jgi:hypothetical protein
VKKPTLVPDETLPITDLIAEEQLENVPMTTEDLDDSTVDLLGDAIAKLYGPSCKCQQSEDKIEEGSTVQTRVVPVSTETAEMKQPTVQSPTSTPANDQSPATESDLLETEPIIVETVLMPTTCNQNGDDQSGGANSYSAATPVPLTQDNSDDINITDEVAQHIMDHYSNDPECDMFDLICGRMKF